jgi:hypothetical protein
MLDTEDFRDKSTPDWSENFSSLNLIKMNIPNRLNITELNQSCNTATMTMGRWERPNNMSMDTPKDHVLPMSMHEDPDEDNTNKETMDTMKLSRNRNCIEGLKQNPLPYKTNPALRHTRVEQMNPLKTMRLTWTPTLLRLMEGISPH